MPITFTIAKPRKTFETQWAFLSKRGRNKERVALRKYLITLLVTTTLYLAFYFLTASNDFITLKVVSIVLIAMSWCTFIIIYSFFSLGNLKSKGRLRHFLDSTTDEQLRYSVQIDEENVSIVSSYSTDILPWIEFDRFGINGETLYVFNAVKRANSLYWDRSEMGEEPFKALLELVKRKSIKQAF